MGTLRRWFLGTGEYAHPVLRWMAWPLFRVVMLVFVVLLFLNKTGHGWTDLKILGAVLLGLSIAAEVANELVLRFRRRRAPG